MTSNQYYVIEDCFVSVSKARYITVLVTGQSLLLRVIDRIKLFRYKWFSGVLAHTALLDITVDHRTSGPAKFKKVYVYVCDAEKWLKRFNAV